MTHRQDGGSMHLWNVYLLQGIYTMWYPRTLLTLHSSSWETEIWNERNLFRIKKIVITRTNSQQDRYYFIYLSVYTDLFICCSFNDAVSSSDYITSNEFMTNK
jgi:hypothetical protein